jgi:peptidoglycan/xylan/chitin deacetylase (PgdA/CDA1 family)
MIFSSRKTNSFVQKSRLFALIVLVLGGLFSSACNSVNPPDAAADIAAVQWSATIKPSATITPTATKTPLPPTATTTPQPSATPEPLAFFSPRFLTGITPVTYQNDTCQYLYNRWSPDKAVPGTVVMPIMYHGIRKEGGSVSDNITVTEKYFKETMQHAKELGFETISIEQLDSFLQSNSYIPPRSMVLIIDDRRLGTVQNHFLPVLEANHWHLVMAYITGVINDQEWAEVKKVLDTGLVEIQAHGFMHNGQTYFTEFTPDDIIHQEIYDPIDAFEQHLGYRPYAFIWPGGNFTQKTVDEVQKAGYQVGFTVYSRGPVMYNWVPLGEEERAMNNPLLVLPRYWSTAAYNNLDEVVNYAQQAIEFARGHRDEELAFYAAYCQDYPPLENPQTLLLEETPTNAGQ